MRKDTHIMDWECTSGYKKNGSEKYWQILVSSSRGCQGHFMMVQPSKLLEDIPLQTPACMSFMPNDAPPHLSVATGTQIKNLHSIQDND
jgi:hypothetical protein